jgi:hypothetical protein
MIPGTLTQYKHDEMITLIGAMLAAAVVVGRSQRKPA